MEYINLTFTANNQDLVINELIALVSKHNCRIQESRMSLLGTEFSGIVRIVGNWNDIAKLEESLGALKPTPEFSFTFKRNAAAVSNTPFLPYLVQVIALDTPELVNEISYFFSTQAIQLVDIQTEPFQTSYSKTAMMTLSMRISVPANINIADLRERFMVLCDELNVDGIIEPEKR